MDGRACTEQIAANGSIPEETRDGRCNQTRAGSRPFVHQGPVGAADGGARRHRRHQRCRSHTPRHHGGNRQIDPGRCTGAICARRPVDGWIHRLRDRAPGARARDEAGAARHGRAGRSAGAQGAAAAAQCACPARGCRSRAGRADVRAHPQGSAGGQSLHRHHPADGGRHRCRRADPPARGHHEPARQPPAPAEHQVPDARHRRARGRTDAAGAGAGDRRPASPAPSSRSSPTAGISPRSRGPKPSTAPCVRG